MSNERNESVERRCMDARLQEMRLNFDNKSPRIVGYAAVFNKETELYPGFREKIAPGAFSESIKNDDVRALINHDPSLILGRNKANTLKLTEDEHGLRYEIIPPDTQAARDLMISIKRGDINQSSFGFNILKRNVDINEEENEMTRTIEKAQLFDVSPVTYPAYPSTEVNVRMMKNEKNELAFLVDDRAIETIPLQDEGTQEPQDKATESDEEFMKRINGFLESTEP